MSLQREAFFHRHDLARRLCGQLISEDGASGLFVTGPRRTGKSTFIREDLVPTLSQEHQVQVVYADLWEDRSADPGKVIAAAIRAELLKFDGFILRAAKGVGMDKIKVGGLEMAIDRIGFGTGETLLKALTILAAASKKPVVLIIDEAQHTQTTEEGRQALYGLKAARDALNASTGPGFRLLATGSNSDKLASLVEEKDQAFYQAPLLALPMLGSDYLAWVRERLRFQPAPSMAALERTFAACNHRPEPLRNVLRSLSLAVESDENKVDALLEQLMAESLAQSKANFLQQVNGLPPLDAAVLKVMAQEGKSFAPYTKAAYTAYSAFMLASTGEMPADVGQSSVQMALERLRGEKFIWRAGRGAYLIEDSQHMALLNEMIAQEKPEVDQARQAVLARAAPQGPPAGTVPA